MGLFKIKADTLYLLSFVLLPIDSFSFIPVNFEHRPLFFLPLFLYWFSQIGKIIQTRNNTQAFTFIIYLVAFLYSLLIVGLTHQDYEPIKKSIFSISLSYVGISASLWFFEKNFKQHGIELTLEHVTRYLKYSLLYTVPVAAIQIIANFKLVSISLSQRVTMLFSYRFNSFGKVQIVSGEPSMAFRYILTCLVFVLLFDKTKYRKMIMALCAGIILLSGSSLGYVSIFLFVVIIVIIKGTWLRPKVIIYIVLVIFGIGYFWAAKDSLLPKYTAQQLNHFSLIVTELDWTIFQANGSLFQRILNPVIGFMVMSETYLLGAGLESFHLFYNDIIYEHFPYAVNHGTIARVLDGEIYITPKNLVSKIASELGIFFLFLFLTLYAHLLFSIHQIKGKFKQYFHPLAVLLAMSILIILNMDSYLYFNYLFILSIVIASVGYLKTKNPNA